MRGAVERLSFFLRDVMDPSMRGFLLSAPEFYTEYVTARRGPAAARMNAGARSQRTATPISSDTALSSLRGAVQ